VRDYHVLASVVWSADGWAFCLRVADRFGYPLSGNALSVAP